ncbi:hypothetical protein BGX23_010509 [Mortierella sp. AD031]|nr:hypothetical protein BGX23_010509 [Mortierella sp. AD031]
MVDYGIFTGAIQLATIINDIARAAQSNKVSCMAMNHRIQIANEIIKAAFEQFKSNPKSFVISESAFKMYFQLLERMRDFVFEISKRKTFSKLFYALRFRDEFDALLRDFDSCVLDLNLGIALRTQAQLETDRNALEEDMVELKVFRKELQNGLDTLGGQLVGIRQMIATNRPMDDILAMVEIDYRQVVSITPSETRKGRTFPVHKRSWLAQEVAEKPLGFFGSQDMLDMLKKEVAILKKLDRCNYITKFMGVTNRNNQISIIMEWLPNGDLASTLAKDEMDWEQKLFIAADIARGLHFLHEVGIIHKTLRAKNILLTRFNQAKITNFRQSRLESAQTRPMSDPFSFVRWLAPEKMTPPEVRYGPECDIYSFGMLLFEIASNKIPFHSFKDRELPEKIVREDLYETVPKGTPPEFGNIMTACWSHDPRLRPTVSQVLLVLRETCEKHTSGDILPLPTSMKDPPPLFAVSPPATKNQGMFSPSMTPVAGLLTPEAYKNPYVNKRYVEESIEDHRKQQVQKQQVHHQQQQQQQQQQHHHSRQNSQGQSFQQPSTQQQAHLALPLQPRPQNQQLQTPQQPTHSPRLQQMTVRPQSQQQQQMGQPESSSHPDYQPSASKQEYMDPVPASNNNLPRTPRPQQSLPTHVQQTQHFNQHTQNGVVFPNDAQMMSPTQSSASSGSPLNSPRALDSPPINRNTRPLTISPKKQSLEADMHRLSVNSDSGSSTFHNSNSDQHSNNSTVQRQQSSQSSQNAHSVHSVHSINSNGSPRSQQQLLPARETTRPRSTGFSPAPVANTMSQALLFHEARERSDAWKIFKVHSDQGHPEGMYWTGYYLFHGEGGQPKDRRTAFELFRAVTLMELSPELRLLSSNAHFYAAVCYLEGQGVERNNTTGFGHMEIAADTGNAFAQFLVGDAYHRGSAVVQVNVQKRDHYWQMAARQKEQRAIDRCKQFGIPF